MPLCAAMVGVISSWPTSDEFIVPLVSALSTLPVNSIAVILLIHPKYKGLNTPPWALQKKVQEVKHEILSKAVRWFAENR